MKKESLIDKITILFLLYPFGIILLFFLGLLRALNVINILHKERLSFNKRGLIVISNHPSLLEPIIIPLLFYKDYLISPIKLRPFSTPDKSNYYDKWYWYWMLRLLSVPIDRGNRRSEVTAFFRMAEIINSEGILILFPEGGRTDNGTDFHYSRKGKRIRILKQGIASLISRTGASVLYIWVEGAEKVMPIVKDKLYVRPRLGRVFIKIGKTVNFEKHISKEKIIQQIQTDLLELADE